MTDDVVLQGVPIHSSGREAPVEAIGLAGATVRASGSLRDVLAAMPPGVPVVELTQGAVLPAFVDAHQHAYLVAADPATDTLRGAARSVPDLVGAIAALVAAGSPSTGWLRFHGYQPMALAERRSPTARELDAAAPDRPLHVLSRTFHESTVNSAGLDLLGIGRTTPDPPGGRIVRDRRGRATGVLLEAASFAAEAASRAAESDDAWQHRLRAHARLLLAHGITRIGDAAVPAVVAQDFVRTLAEEGVDARPLLVGARIDEPALVAGGTAKVLADGGEYCHLCMSGRQLRTLLRASVRASFGPDGALARAVGRRSGYPRRDGAGRWRTGVSLPGEGALPALLRRASDTGSALAVHAVGNGAVDSVLDSVAVLAGSDAPQVRLEHALVLDPRLTRAIAGAGLPVVAQPAFLPGFGHELTVVPLPRPLELMPFRAMLEAGITLAFSSDYPATDLDPWLGIAAAVDRRDDTGTPLLAGESIGVGQAIDAYTRTAASVLGAPEAGRLHPGCPADLIWVDRDPFRTDSDSLPGVRTLATWSAGRLRHCDPGVATRLAAHSRVVT